MNTCTYPFFNVFLKATFHFQLKQIMVLFYIISFIILELKGFTLIHSISLEIGTIEWRIFYNEYAEEN